MAATVKKTFDIALDIAASSSNRAFTVVEGDTGNVLRIALTDDGEPVDLTGCRVIAVFSKSNGTAAQDSGQEDGGVQLQGALNNQVCIDLFPPSFAPGMVECELLRTTPCALWSPRQNSTSTAGPPCYRRTPWNPPASCPCSGP